MMVHRLGERGVAVLLEQYLRRLQEDPLLATPAESGHHASTLQWAADELQQTATTLHGLTQEEAEYELTAVLREARERISLGTQGTDLVSSSA